MFQLQQQRPMASDRVAGRLCCRLQLRIPIRAAAFLAVAALLMDPSRVTAQLGTASGFGTLGASTVTNTGATTITGDLGVWSGSAITGSGTITLTGALHQTDGVAQQAQSDATTAYNTFFNMPCTTNLSGQVLGSAGFTSLTPGVYCFSSSAQLTGALQP